ncbi:MAG TPA: tryptophan synthase subunit alpha [Fodinibius sp.]|nr:tryptophan synthase subunit alpha [Fodinibius sp.]
MNKINNRLTRLFKSRNDSAKLMSLFLTAGYPDLDATVDLVLGLEEHGADFIELGVPFSDPLADGPTIQYSSNVALEQGTTISKIFDMVKKIRASSELPILLMGYMNPILKYGIESFCKDAAEAGIDGLIIPDIPIEESGILKHHVQQNGLAQVYLVAPNTSDERMQKIDEQSQGFVYCVSVTGVTGARDGDEVARSVQRFISRVKKNITRNPKMVGFGIKSHEDARRTAADMDGFIVGSALINTIRQHYPNKDWMKQTFDFAESLKYG